MAQSNAEAAGLRLETGDGPIIGRVSVLQDDARSSLETEAIAEGAEAIVLELRSERSTPTQLYVDFVAVDVFGQRPESRLDGEVRLLRPGQTWTLELRAGRDPLAPGAWRIDVAVEEGPFESLTLQVDPIAPPAERITPAQWPTGFNLALADLGAEVVRYSSQYNEGSRSITELIDGFPLLYDQSGGTRSRGWHTVPAAGYPAEVVLAFHEQRVAQIQAIVVDSAGLEYDNPGVPRHVEVLVAEDPDGASFRRVAEARLWPVYDAQLIRFEPVAARFVMLRVLSAHGNRNAFGIGELSVIEAAGPGGSILADRELNLLLPTLGGNVEHFTSQDSGNPAWRLADGAVGERGSWMARADEQNDTAVLPQDFVFSFKHGRSALVDRVVIDVDSQPSFSVGNFSNRWPAQVAVAISDSLDGPFTEVARSELQQEPGPQSIAIDQRARFVQLRILENYGGPNTTIGEVSIIEGSQPDYVSVVAQVAEPLPPPVPLVRERQPDVHEANDLAENASSYRPGEALNGTLHAFTDVDYYRFEVPGDAEQLLTLELEGEPSLGIQLQLTHPAANGTQAFTFSGNPRRATSLSWRVPSGEQLLRIADVPLNVVLVWDGSGSMEGRTDALETAVRRYLGNLGAGEQVQLVHFSDRVSVLLEDFTSDPDLIWPALEGRFEAYGATALVDALDEALALLQGRPGRQVVILFTDGHDSASEMPAHDVEAALKTSAAQIYTIGLGASLHNYSQRMGGSGTRFLQRTAQASNGRYFHAADSAALDPIFDTIAAEVRVVPQYTLRAQISTETGYLAVSSIGEPITALTPPRFELILDASGSMKERVSDGRTRMAVAKEVLKATIDGLPAGVNVALRTFGRRIREGSAGDCQDSELLVPFGIGQAEQLKQSIDEVVALGTTPIAYSLEQAVADLAELDEEALIVLVTDGEEECEPDLQAALTQLQDRGVPFRLNIVGFEIGDETVSAMLEALALQAGGIYVATGAAAALDKALELSLSSRFVVEDQAGQQVATGVVGQAAIELPAGVYRLRVESSAELLDLHELRIEPERTTVVELSKAGNAIATSMRME